MFRMVEFESESASLRGRLYQPSNPSAPTAIVIMAHGFTATMNGMVADQYAEVFAAAGLSVLLYDHYSFGQSGGEPRWQINKWIQTRGYLDAVDFVSTLVEVDPARIAIWGDSMSGAEVIVAGALDARVKVVVAQVPACGDEPSPPDPNGLLFASLGETLLHGNLTALPSTSTGPMPVVSFDQMNNPSLLTPLTAFRWFIEYGGRYGTLWENSATFISPEASAPLHPGLCSPHLHAALLMVIAREDEMPGANSAVARQVFEAAPQPKEMIEIGGGHFGLLFYPSPLFDQVSTAQCDFLLKHL